MPDVRTQPIHELLIAVAKPDAGEDSRERKRAWDEITRRDLERRGLEIILDNRNEQLESLAAALDSSYRYRESQEGLPRGTIKGVLPGKSTGPGCDRHKGDPHNLCPACWDSEDPDFKADDEFTV